MTTTRRRVPRTALVLVAAGLLLAAVAGTVLAVRVVPVFGEAVSAPERTLPLDATLDLQRGVYAVYELTGTRRGAGGVTVSTNRTPALAADDVQVTAPDGTTLAITTSSGVETLQRGTTVWTAVGRFEVPAAGRHRVTVSDGTGDGTGERAGRVVVARTPIALVARSLGWVGAVALGAFLVAAGLVWLVVGLLRGRRPAYVVAPAGAPPPGWYPDPERPGAHRWWDGGRWADPPG